MFKTIVSKLFGNNLYFKMYNVKRKCIDLYNYNLFRVKVRYLKRPIRILITRYSGLGDILATTPAIRFLRRKFPNAIIVYDTSFCGEMILRFNKNIDEITIDRYRHDKGGFDYHWHMNYECHPNMHMVDSYIYSLGIEFKLADKEKYTEIIIDKIDRAFALAFVKAACLEEKKLIAYSVQANNANRMWPLERFSEVIDRIKMAYPDIEFIELGSSDSASLGKGISLVGKCSLRETFAIVKLCDLVFCSDSFFLHLAGALKKPLLALFGPVSPDVRLPFNNMSYGLSPRRGCRFCVQKNMQNLLSDCLCTRKENECMLSLKVNDVVKKLDVIIKTFLHTCC